MVTKSGSSGGSGSSSKEYSFSLCSRGRGPTRSSSPLGLPVTTLVNDTEARAEFGITDLLVGATAVKILCPVKSEAEKSRFAEQLATWFSIDEDGSLQAATLGRGKDCVWGGFVNVIEKARDANLLGERSDLIFRYKFPPSVALQLPNVHQSVRQDTAEKDQRGCSKRKNSERSQMIVPHGLVGHSTNIASPSNFPLKAPEIATGCARVANVEEASCSSVLGVAPRAPNNPVIKIPLPALSSCVSDSRKKYLRGTGPGSQNTTPVQSMREPANNLGALTMCWACPEPAWTRTPPVWTTAVPPPAAQSDEWLTERRCTWQHVHS